MKKITTGTWVLDNAGNYHAPGSELTVGDDERDGCITADTAKQLADQDAVRARLAAAAEPAPAAPAA